MLLRFKTPFLIGLAALFGLAPPLLIPATSAAVTISLVPDRPPTIKVGETVNVDVFIVLDAGDQAAGISLVIMVLEYGGGLVTVAGSGEGSPFPTAFVTPKPPTPPHPNADSILFLQVGTTVNAAEAFLGSLTLTGAMEGSYDLVARRSSSSPLFAVLGSLATRYDFASDETLRIKVCDGACPIAIHAPEPHTFALLGLALTGLILLRSPRREHSKRSPGA